MAHVNPLQFVGSNLPRMENDHPDVFPGSVLALVGCFVSAMQARFSQDNASSLPWVWKSDPTPNIDEDNSKDAPRTLFIESAYNEEPDARDPRPAILVGNGATQFVQLWIGNTAAYHQPTATKVIIVHAITEIQFECLSNRRGESMQLAQMVADFMTASKDDLREAFSLHHITPVQISECAPQRRDNSAIESWRTVVAMQVQGKLLYLHWPIAPVLAEIVATLNANPKGFEAAAVDIALYSKRIR